VEIAEQTVTVGYASLAAGQTVQFSIFTTVLQGVEVRNTACVSAANLAQERCATGAIIRSLPNTGEMSRWPFIKQTTLLTIVMAGIIIGIWSCLRRNRRRI